MEKGIIRTFKLKTALAQPVGTTVTVTGVQHEWLVEFPTIEQARAFARQVREDGVEMSEEAIEALAIRFGALAVPA